MNDKQAMDASFEKMKKMHQKEGSNTDKPLRCEITKVIV